MSASPAGSALYCVFHNDHRYTSTKTKLACSHIFSGVVRPGKGGFVLTGQDFDGTDAAIMTDLSRREFNLAATVPIPAEAARTLLQTVERINQMGQEGVWPFYFSVDMSVKPHREETGKLAIAPEGNIDPPVREQRPEAYGASTHADDNPFELTRARINCVRMTMLAARLAGIDVPKIADINTCFNTGEEVRDRIREAAARCKGGHQRHSGSRGTHGLFGQKDKAEGQITGVNHGLSVIEAQTPIRLSKFMEALSRKFEGRTMFDWMTKGKAQSFVTEPDELPAYLQKALDLAGLLPEPAAVGNQRWAGTDRPLAEPSLRLPSYSKK